MSSDLILKNIRLSCYIIFSEAYSAEKPKLKTKNAFDSGTNHYTESVKQDKPKTVAIYVAPANGPAV